MAATVSAPLIREALGKEFYVVIQFTADTSYPNTNGYPITPAMFGLNSFASQPLVGTPAIPAWEIEAENLTSPAWYAYADFSTGALRLAVATTGVQVANTIDVHTYTAILGALGH